MRAHRLHYWTHRGRRKHPSSLVGRVGTGLLLPIMLVILAVSGTTGALFIPHPYTLAAGGLLLALGASLLRLFVSYLIALFVGVPLGLLASANRRIESILLPIYDVLESMPVLAFFPALILLFLRSGSLEGAAIFIIFFSMVWNIAFNTIGGLKVIPSDIHAVGKVFGLSRFERFFRITLPALFPHLVTASILALADGWNIVIVAETLSVYAPSNVEAHNLYGIGSILVSAGASGDTSTLLLAMGALVAVIALVNIFIWQPLLARSERYKFE